MVRIAAVSLKRINSMPILAAARIPVQMEFLVGTTGLDTRTARNYRCCAWGGAPESVRIHS